MILFLQCTTDFAGLKYLNVINYNLKMSVILCKHAAV